MAGELEKLKRARDAFERAADAETFGLDFYVIRHFVESEDFYDKNGNRVQVDKFSMMIGIVFGMVAEREGSGE